MSTDLAAAQKAEAVTTELAREATHVRRNAPQRAQSAQDLRVAVTLAVSRNPRECVTFHAASPKLSTVPNRAP